MKSNNYLDKKENINTYNSISKSRPNWGQQWDESSMNYLYSLGVWKSFKKFIKNSTDSKLLVLGGSEEPGYLHESFSEIIVINISKKSKIPN